MERELSLFGTSLLALVLLSACPPTDGDRPTTPEPFRILVGARPGFVYSRRNSGLRGGIPGQQHKVLALRQRRCLVGWQRSNFHGFVERSDHHHQPRVQWLLRLECIVRRRHEWFDVPEFVLLSSHFQWPFTQWDHVHQDHRSLGGRLHGGNLERFFHQPYGEHVLARSAGRGSFSLEHGQRQ